MSFIIIIILITKRWQTYYSVGHTSYLKKNSELSYKQDIMRTVIGRKF